MIPDGVFLRPDSCDELVFNEVWVEDVYRMATFPAPEPTDAALDLGANVGAWTLKAFDKECLTVVAVEPMMSNAEQLMRNVEAQNLGPQFAVEVVPAAIVGNREHEMLTMIAGDEKFPSITYRAAHGKGPRVPTLHIDDVLSWHDHWWMVKCDIEGGEHDVFRGASLDSLNRVDYLTMEFHGPGMGQHTAWIGSDWLGELLCKLTEWGSIQTLGAASRGGMIFGWRYGVQAPRMWQE